MPAIERVKNLFGRKTQPPLREPVAVVLARTPLPDRQVSLADISLYNAFPIDFAAGKRLAIALNTVKETPLDQFDIARLKPSPDIYPAIPSAASFIAHHYDSDIPVILPSEEEAKAIKPWLRSVSLVLGRIYPGWQYRVDRFIERRAASKVIADTTEKILRKVDPIGEIDNLKSRFVPELTNLYKEATKPEYRDKQVVDPVEDFLNIFNAEYKPEIIRVEVPIEQKVANLVTKLRDAKNGFQGGRINKESYPLIVRALEFSKFPSESTDENTAGVVGSEIMSGIEEFLRKQGVKDLIPAPKPVRTFDFFDGDTWNGDSIMRSLAETFKWEQVIAVERSLPVILIEISNLLPESGPEVIVAVRTLAENILILSKQGVSNAEIAAAIFSKNTPPPKA